MARDGALDDLAVGRRVALRVDQPDAPWRDALERLDLVLHQRDERADDQREVGAHERRQLVAERLARAGGHDHQHVAVGERRLHGLGLAAPEALEAEQLAQRALGVGRARDGFRRWRAEAGECEDGFHRPPDHSGALGGSWRVQEFRYTRASGSACSKVSLVCDSPVFSSGYSPVKQASQWVARSPSMAS